MVWNEMSVAEAWSEAGTTEGRISGVRGVM